MADLKTINIPDSMKDTSNNSVSSINPVSSKLIRPNIPDNSSSETVDFISKNVIVDNHHLLARLAITHHAEFKTSNLDKHARLNGVVNYSGTTKICIPPDRKGCNQMSGSCETDDYLIVSYKTNNDKMQKIVFYDKKTNKPIGDFVTDKFNHSNSLTTDGKNVYVVNANSNEYVDGDKDKGLIYSDGEKISSFSIDEALAKCSYSNRNREFCNSILNIRAFMFHRTFDYCPEITTKKLSIPTDHGTINSITSMDYDPKSGVTVAASGTKLYIVNGGKEFTVDKFDYSNQYANTNQDICVAKNSIYVLRTKISDDDEWGIRQYDEARNQGRKSGEEYIKDQLVPPSSDLDERNQTVKGKYIAEYNVVDIYDLEGNYKCTKKIPIPTGNNDSAENIYRELESISYDESTDSFTLYFNNPYDKATDDHVIVRGVDLPSAEESVPTFKHSDEDVMSV